MKIGFFGTPEIAAYNLEKLAQEHEVLFTVTGTDKPAGRHGTPVFSAVKETAIQKKIPVLQPVNLLDNEFLNRISEYKADIFVVVAYGKILPAQIFDLPPLKTVNVHPSLLPKYRGAAPIQWALINGENETGISIQYINEKLDSGDIILQKNIPLNINMSANDLMEIVLPMGSEMLIEALTQLESGNAKPVKQDEAEATFCGKINRQTACIDWNKSALEIHNLIRGLNPKPVAWTTFRGKNIKIYNSKIVDNENGIALKPGELKKIEKKLFAVTGKHLLELLELQPEGKKIINASSFINGYRLSEGDCFEFSQS